MARSRAAAADMPRTLRRAMATFSSAVRWSNRLKSWKIMPTWARKAQSLDLLEKSSFSPSRMISPLSGGMRQLMHCKSVLLPAPEGPMRTLSSPRFMFREQLSRMDLPPRLLLMPFTCKTTSFMRSLPHAACFWPCCPPCRRSSRGSEPCFPGGARA